MPVIATVFVLVYVVVTALLAALHPIHFFSLVSFLFFTILNLLSWALVPKFWPQFKTFKLRSEWINIQISLVHASISSIVVLLTLFTHWRDFMTMYKPSMSPFPMLIIAFSAGYFAYDTWDTLKLGNFKANLSVLLHHFALLVCFMIGLHLNLGLLYLVATLGCEVNSVFLHLRRLMGWASYTWNNAAYRFVWNAFFVTMWPTRLVLHLYLLGQVILDIGHWHSPILAIIASLGLAFINYTNFTLYQGSSKRYKKDRMLGSQGKTK